MNKDQKNRWFTNMEATSALGIVMSALCGACACVTPKEDAWWTVFFAICAASAVIAVSAYCLARFVFGRGCHGRKKSF